MSLTTVQLDMLAAVPSCIGKRASSDQTIAASGVIIYNTVVDDPFSMLNTSTGVITLNRAGIWIIGCNFEWTAITAGTNASYLVNKNGSTAILTGFLSQLGATTTIQTGGFAQGFRFAKNDTVSVTATGDASFAIDSGVNVSNQISAIWQGN